jgi:hypothetical protein
VRVALAAVLTHLLTMWPHTVQAVRAAYDATRAASEPDRKPTKLTVPAGTRFASVMIAFTSLLRNKEVLQALMFDTKVKTFVDKNKSTRTKDGMSKKVSTHRCTPGNVPTSCAWVRSWSAQGFEPSSAARRRWARRAKA